MLEVRAPVPTSSRKLKQLMSGQSGHVRTIPSTEECSSTRRPSAISSAGPARTAPSGGSQLRMPVGLADGWAKFAVGVGHVQSIDSNIRKGFCMLDLERHWCLKLSSLTVRHRLRTATPTWHDQVPRCRSSSPPGHDSRRVALGSHRDETQNQH